MGNLPNVRVCQGRPFLIVGIDYGGLFMVKNSRLRIILGNISLFYNQDHISDGYVSFVN